MVSGAEQRLNSAATVPVLCRAASLYAQPPACMGAAVQHRYAGKLAELDSVPVQVMGAPLAGSPVRATVTGGGGLRLKGLQPRWRSRRLYMLFPLRGTERRGIVSLEAKKRQVGHCWAAGQCRQDGTFAGITEVAATKGLQIEGILLQARPASARWLRSSTLSHWLATGARPHGVHSMAMLDSNGQLT